MDIKGLDKIKNMNNNDSEEIRVTGLDFNNQTVNNTSEQESEQSYDFIRKLDTDHSEQNEHGVTGLDFITHGVGVSEEVSASEFDFISREGESKGSSDSPEGLDSIKQIEFGDMGITIHND